MASIAADGRAGPGAPAAARGLSPGEIVAGTLILSMAPFVSILDMTLVNVILPHVAGDYGATPNEATLVITFFAVTQAISMMLSGWLTQRFGLVRTFTAALFGFAVASLLCGSSTSLNMLIVSRMLQGFAAGPIIPLSQSIIQRIFPPKAAARALSIWGIAMMSGPLLGPTLGGTLADSIGWSWGFFVNVPIALVCMVLAHRMFAKYESPAARVPIDFVGLALMAIFVGSLQFVLDYGSRLEWWDSSLITTLALSAGIGFVLFLIWELTDKHPIVDLSIFRYRSFAIVAIISAISYGLTVGSSVLAYLWLQTVMGYTSTWTGYIAATAGIPSLFIGPLAGYLSGKIDLRWMATIGLIVSGMVNLYRATFTTAIDVAHLLIPQILVGLSGPFYFAPLISIGMFGLPKDKISSGAGLITVSRTLAFALTTAIMTTMWEHDTKRAYGEIATLTNPDTFGMLFGHMSVTSDRGLAILNIMIQAQAVTISMRQLFLVAGGLTALCAIAIWFTPKIAFQKPVAPVADH